MSVLDDIAALLRGDGTITGYITGGIFGDPGDGAKPAGAEEISQTRTPAAFDANKEIKPTIFVAREQVVTRDGQVDNGEDIFIALFCYERRGYENIRPTLARVYQLLHRQPLAGYLLIRRVNELSEIRDPGLDCSMGQQRYQLTRVVA
jgi:hypothetical protein